MKKAILIAGHGSTSKNNESAMELQARLLKEKGYVDVFYGYKGYSKPFIQDVLKDLAEEFDEIVVVPLFIAKGHYTDVVIPKRLGLPENCSEGTVEIDGRKVHLIITDVFGSHVLMTDAIMKNAEKLRTKDNSGILLIGHGSKSPENHDMVLLNADRLRYFCWMNRRCIWMLTISSI